ncbi:hypothetical protein WR25_19807 [Diploscapter pachys]|uniref:Uncharacterized protein n=1 Tax=Diploscapter pachys TaxID=2018661 RepID=A0A2A2L6M6_9BILA|nr:hypothetical protein WR25_17320 [Diploscapter pachys]PAV83254.1 hypothetical protein WR25_19807 [Diploscapter pachys]
MTSVSNSPMPLFHYNSPASIRAKTRALLELDKECELRNHPYAFSSRQRRLSTSSCSSSSSDYSLSQQLSPCSSSGYFSSPIASPDEQSLREMHVFERLRQIVPELPADKTAFQILVDTVSEVMELEQQLEELTEQTNGFKSALHFQTNDSDDATKQDADCQISMPADLLSVDVSQFKTLVYEQPLEIDPELLR